jgi:hypothetical protein
LAAVVVAAGTDLGFGLSVAVLTWSSSVAAQAPAPIFITGCAFRC